MANEVGGTGTIETSGPVREDGPGESKPGGAGNAAKVGCGVLAFLGCGGAGCLGCLAIVIGCMLMVSTVGGGAAIAIPNFISMQLRAKRAEAPSNLDGIRTAEKAYHAEWDVFTSVGPYPFILPGREPVEWNSSEASDFALLGWDADGAVRCVYEVRAVEGDSSQSDNFTALATCDVDGDSNPAIFEANRAEKARMTTSANVY